MALNKETSPTKPFDRRTDKPQRVNHHPYIFAGFRVDGFSSAIAGKTKPWAFMSSLRKQLLLGKTSLKGLKTLRADVIGDNISQVINCYNIA